MDTLQNHKMIDANSIFDHGFMSSKPLYLYHFGKFPNVHYINSLDGEKAYGAFRGTFGHLIVSEYQYRWYDTKRRKFRFDETIFLLNNNCLVELDNYCEVLHDGTQPEFVEACMQLMHRHREKQKREPLEINLVVSNGRGLSLKPMEIKRTRLDIGLYYEDDFAEVDAIIGFRSTLMSN